jgi:hypothetical protein
MKLLSKILLKIAAFLYPRFDELLLERLSMIMFPGKNFNILINDTQIFDQRIVFKLIKPYVNRLEKYYIIAVYYPDAHRINIEAIKKEDITGDQVACQIIEKLYEEF